MWRESPQPCPEPTGVKHAERHAPPAPARNINAETAEFRRVSFSRSRALQAVTVGPRRGRATAYSHDGGIASSSPSGPPWGSSSVLLGIRPVVATGTRLRGGATSSHGRMPALETGGWSHSAPGCSPHDPLTTPGLCAHSSARRKSRGRAGSPTPDPLAARRPSASCRRRWAIVVVRPRDKIARERRVVGPLGASDAPFLRCLLRPAVGWSEECRARLWICGRAAIRRGEREQA